MRTWEHRNYEWDRENSIKESDSEFPDYHDGQSNSNTVRKSPYTNNASPEREKASMQNRTIINLSEKGTTIQNGYVVSTVDSDKVLNGHRSTTPIMTIDKKTIVVDVHRSEEEFRSFGAENNVTNISCQVVEDIKMGLRKVSAVSQVSTVSTSGSVLSHSNSTSSGTTNSSLSNAISEEFQRRAEVNILTLPTLLNKKNTS